MEDGHCLVLKHSGLALLGALVAFMSLPVHADPSPEAVVDAQLTAYNARDVEAFLSTYADDAELFEHPSTLLASGVAQMRPRYAARFAEPNLHAVIVKRIVMGNLVVDHEIVTRTFPEGTGTQEALATYEVIGGRITRVWFVTGAKRVDPKPSSESR